MIRSRLFFRVNQQRINDWVMQRKNRIWSERKVTQEIECAGGKSSLVPLWGHTLKSMGVIDKVCWVVPRLNLARQAVQVFNADHWNWSQVGVPPADAANYSIRYSENGNEINPSKGMFGYAISYHSVASDLPLHVQEFQRSRYLLVLDEPQFAKIEKSFGLHIEDLAKHAAFILILSGDYDTNGTERVALVDYVASRDPQDPKYYVQTDYRYTYLDSLSDNAILPIDFNYGDGRVSYFNLNTQELYQYASMREVDADQVRSSLRALLKTEYAFQLLDACVADWLEFRSKGIHREGRFYPPFKKSQLLVVAGNINEARRMHEHLIDPNGEWKIHPDQVVIVTSQDDDPIGKLESFRENRPYKNHGLPVRIAITVAMAYVGMDAPDISHLCVLTFYRSEPWIHQLLARAWRLYQSKHNIAFQDQYCVAFIPPDKLLDEIVVHIRDSIRVGWREPGEGHEGGGGSRRQPDTIIADFGELIDQWRKYALDPQSVRAQKAHLGSVLFDLEKIWQSLVNSGIPDEIVAEMMAVAEMRLSRTPKTRSREEQYAIDRTELEAYQAETVTTLMALFGWVYPADSDKWQGLKSFVSGKLKENFNGRGVAALDADEMGEAVRNAAPYLRQWCINNKVHVRDRVLSYRRGGRHAA